MACFPPLSQAQFLHGITAYPLTIHFGATQVSGANSKYKVNGLLLHQLHSQGHHNDFSLVLHTLTLIVFEELGTPGMWALFAH